MVFQGTKANTAHIISPFCYADHLGTRSAKPFDQHPCHSIVEIYRSMRFLNPSPPILLTTAMTSQLAALLKAPWFLS